MTLTEIVVALSLLLGIGGTVLVASGSLSSAFQTGSSLARLDRAAHDGVTRIAQRLEGAAPDTLLPLLADTTMGETAIEFERVVGYADGDSVLDPAERIALEPSPTDPLDGADNDGNGLVDEGWLVWTERIGTGQENRHVLAKNVALVAEGEIPGNGKDDNGDGLVDESGFALVWDGRTVTVRLTCEWSVAAGTVARRSFERSVAFLNAAE